MPVTSLSLLSATCDTLLLPTPSCASCDWAPLTFCFSPENRLPTADVAADGDFLIGTAGFLPKTGGGVVFFSSKLSMLFRMSIGVLLSFRLFRGGFSVSSTVLFSSDRRWAATLPNKEVERLDSLSESLEPKLSLRNALFGDLLVVMILEPTGGRSGLSRAGEAKNGQKLS